MTAANPVARREAACIGGRAHGRVAGRHPIGGRHHAPGGRGRDPHRRALRVRPGAAGEPRSEARRSGPTGSGRASCRARPVRSSDRLELSLHEIDLDAGAVLETGCVYIAELQESLALPEDLRGREPEELDRPDRRLHPRDHRPAREFDTIEAGYEGRSMPRSRRAPSRSSSGPARASPSSACARARCACPTRSFTRCTPANAWSPPPNPRSRTGWRSASTSAGSGRTSSSATGPSATPRRRRGPAGRLPIADFWEPLTPDATAAR